MEILKETQLENGDYNWEISYTDEEFDTFKTYVKTKGTDIDKISHEDIVQLAIEGILKEEIEKYERKENAEDGT